MADHCEVLSAFFNLEFKDPVMLKRLNDITSFDEEDKIHILYTLDALIKNVKIKSM